MEADSDEVYINTKGWVPLDRKLLTSSIWTDVGKKGRFTKGQALVDLYLLADYETYTSSKGTKYEKGTVHYSETFLAKRWHWDRGTVDRFLKHLEHNGIINVRQKSTSKGTTVFWLNYGIHEGFSETKTQGNAQKKHNGKAKNAHSKTIQQTNKQTSPKGEVTEDLSTSAASANAGSLVPEDAVDNESYEEWKGRIEHGSI